MNDAITAALAVIVAAIVAGITGWLTARASAKGSVKAAQVTSLAELEREAGKRAFDYYEGVIKRQETEAGQAAEERRREREESSRQITVLETRVEAAETALRECKDACRALARHLRPEAEE